MPKPGEMGATADAVDVLTADHRMVEHLFTQFEAAGDGELSRDLAEQIIRELSVHAVIEEQVLYPAARRALEGEGLVDHSLDEHQDVKNLLAEIEGKPAGDPDVRRLMMQVKAAVEEHVSDEEGELFPRLREKLDAERLRELAVKMDRAKKVAPTHPHPHAPNRPPGNVIAGLPAALVDKVRDALSSRS